ncbi:MAG: hypothetical protein FWD42_10810 [Solirubrobacterales bacterium]|nr:hypothetical protein [Solirubrobacterales bacterium]
MADIDTKIFSVDSEEQVRALADLVLSDEREYPIVCLTARADEQEPALSVEEVRKIVGAELPLWMIAGRYHRRRTELLAELLPRDLEVYDGATRVWWPGVKPGCDPLEHPLIFASRDPYRRLADAFEPLQLADLELTPKQQIVALERRVRAAEQRRRAVEVERDELARRLEQSSGERAAAPERAARVSRPRERPPEAERSIADTASALDAELRWPVLLVLEWGEALRSPADRREWPLGLHRFLPGFDATTRRIDVPARRLAWVCAMVACERAAHTGLEPHLLRTGPGGKTAALERDDGAVAWRCAVGRAGAGGPRLHYWRRRDGAIEFASLKIHDDMSIPAA